MATRKKDKPVPALRDKPPSPFTPGSPVLPELFVGRSDQIEEVCRYARQACSGRLENIFLSGDRGIGKSSLAQFVRQLCSKELDMLGIHVFLGGESTLEGLVLHVFNQLLQETHEQSWFDKIKDMFGNYVKTVGLFGISVEFEPPKDALKGLVREFPAAINNVFQKIKTEKKGLLIVLDDINGLADKPAFANWYKSLVDRVATPNDFPVMIMLCGLPERRDSLTRLQPSLMRIFRVVEIEKLSNDEAEEFLQQAFGSVNIKVDDDAMHEMTTFCSGLPALMHEIGDATYWTDTDGVVSIDDAHRGIVEAAKNVGQKYLDPKVYGAIRSELYRTILGKLGTDLTTVVFHKSEVEKRLNEEEKKVFHNFLGRMRKLGVIEPDTERGRGAYRFVNRIFPIYIHMQSGADKKR